MSAMRLVVIVAFGACTRPSAPAQAGAAGTAARARAGAEWGACTHVGPFDAPSTKWVPGPAPAMTQGRVGRVGGPRRARMRCIDPGANVLDQCKLVPCQLSVRSRSRGEEDASCKDPGEDPTRSAGSLHDASFPGEKTQRMNCTHAGPAAVSEHAFAACVMPDRRPLAPSPPHSSAACALPASALHSAPTTLTHPTVAAKAAPAAQETLRLRGGGIYLHTHTYLHIMCVFVCVYVCVCVCVCVCV